MHPAECHCRCGNRVVVLVACLLLGLPRPSAAQDVTGAQVKRAIAAGVRALKSRQSPDGSWSVRYPHPGGGTCLVTLALLQAGEPVASRQMAAALDQIRNLADQRVYVVSLKIMVLAQADPDRYRREIQAGAQWLIKAQTKAGLWSYTQAGGNFDHSNSQFALLGLHAAAQVGVHIPTAVWRRAQTAVLRTQNRDGGWPYRSRGGSYGSMTAAGVADLIILGHTPVAGREQGFRNGKAPGCGKYKANKPLLNGLSWLGRHFRADQNPQRRRSWVHYWLYAVERCGILSGRRSFGHHDWYREGAAHLVRTQGLAGTWGDGVVDTAFAILFLAKGHKPLLIQKLQWSDDDAWNPDRHDAAHLVSFVGDKLGEPTAWQVVDFDAPLEDWLAAPLLYMQGHRFPEWNADQRAKVRDYIEQGGTLLAEACCGHDEFRAGFLRFAAQTFSEVPLRELDPGHPVYHTYDDAEPHGLMGIDLGCRTSIIFSPNDLSCLWEQGDVPRLSERGFKLGLNIAAYAVGRRPLRDRLDVITLPTLREDEPALPPGDALRLAQVVHDGDWRPDPQALVRLAEFLRDNSQLDVVTRYKPLHLSAPELYTCPVLFMTGHYDFHLSEEERTALAAHLRRGGFLFAEACCGRAAFDRSFRAMVREAFPDHELEPLPPEHPIFRGEPGFDLETVRYKPAVLREEPGLTEPRLWGLEIDGRLALVYSPYAVGCGLEGHVCHDCRGLVDEDARRLAANVVLHALTH